MLELTLVQLPESFLNELKSSGLNQNFPYTTLPMIKLQVHKGLTARVDVGLSYLALLRYSVYGGDIKYALHVPEEGPTWAIRICHTVSNLDYIRTSSWSPQLLVSRKLDFAEAYLGAEYTWIWGRIVGSQTQNLGPPIGTVTASVDIDDIRSTSASTFLGLGLRVPALGLKVGLEGAYSFVKAHSLGLQLGFSW